MNKEKINQRKQQIIDRQRKTQAKKSLWIGLSSLAVIFVVGFIVYNATRPPLGLDAGVSMQVLKHIPDGSELPAYKTNPPTGGVHYPSTFPAKFFEPTELAGLPAHPEGYLVHNLEHGYVVIWYNCTNLNAGQCEKLKEQIKGTMAKLNGVKVIGFPWEGMEQNVALTSWNRILTMKKFSQTNALEFIQVNRNKSPEPNTP